MYSSNQFDKKYSDITGRVISCAFSVHNYFGNGFEEKIYQRAMAVEFQFRKVNYVKEKEIGIIYRNVSIGTRRVDFLIDDKIILEIKRAKEIEPEHIAQVFNYLEVFNLEIALLINFGTTRIKIHRLTNKNYKP